MLVKHLDKVNVTKSFNSKGLLFRSKYLNLLLHYESKNVSQVYYSRCEGVHRGTSLSFKFVNWRSAAIGLHKVREYTHFARINQLENSLV
jgi:hypothetical protein